ncbi:MAG: prepilin-type N-terminal cleavage/methylation domain-containing protein [Phycisphaeraceae bacterium]
MGFFTVRRQPGFTLIELLVVVSILALLIGLLLPALAQVRPVAREAECMSQLRQLAVAQYAYQLDYGVFSRLWAGSVSDGEAEHVRMISPLEGYLGLDVSARDTMTGAGSVLHCPSVLQDDLDRLASRGILPYPGEQYSSYGINGAMYFDRWGFGYDVIPGPSTIILLGDQAVEPFERQVTSDGWYVIPGFTRWAGLTGHAPERGYRHRDSGSPMVFADGHASGMLDEELVLDGGHWCWWDPAGDPRQPAEGDERCGCED